MIEEGIHKGGNFVIPCQFEAADEFSDDGLAPVKQGGKWGYIDQTGKMIIKPQFDGGRPFDNGLAEVKSGDAFGYVDKTGNYVWKPSK